MKNFLFVIPRYAEYGKYYVFPIGFAYVVSCMKKNGFNVFCLNLCHHEDSVEKLLSECIKDKQIDVLCTGAMSFYWNEVEEILLAAKRIKPEIVNVVGGAIITADPKFALENMRIDYGVIGEGEETMVELAAVLCKGEDPGEVKGLIFLDKNNKAITTRPRESIADLDSLPLPDYEGLEFDKWVSIRWLAQPSIGGLCFDISEKQRLCEIITSRGCPFSCTFCYHPIGRKYRQRSLDNVFKEIDYLVKKYDINILNLLDELFSLDEKRIYEFTERIKKYNIRWMAQWRVNNVNKPILRALKDSGILTLGFGVESMSNKILASMEKRITKDQIERAFKLAADEGVRAEGNIILGDPQETEETCKESIDWWMKHPQYDITPGFLLAVPDAPVYRYALAHNLIKDKLQFIKDKFPVINLTKLDNDKFYRIYRKIAYYTLSQKYLLRGRVLCSKKESEIYYGKHVYSFEIECSVCRHISKYKYILYSSRPYSIILCKNCYKRLKISTKKAFPLDYNAFKGFLFHNAFLIYFMYFKKYSFFSNTAKMLKRILRKVGLPEYGGWLK